MQQKLNFYVSASENMSWSIGSTERSADQRLHVYYSHQLKTPDIRGGSLAEEGVL